VIYTSLTKANGGFSDSGFYFSQGTSEGATLVDGNINDWSFTSDGTDVYYSSPMDGNRPMIWSSVTRSKQALGTDPRTWDYAKGPGDDFAAALAPHSDQIAFHKDDLLFLVNSVTNELCEVQVAPTRPYIVYAQWSPKGHYLALLTAQDWRSIQRNLVIIDVRSGKQIRPELPDLGKYILANVAWAPDESALAVMTASAWERGSLLFIVQLPDGKPFEPFSDILLSGRSGMNIVWSPDGKKLALICPTFWGSEKVLFSICISEYRVSP
jgi:Tol biopolymer transport system component